MDPPPSPSLGAALAQTLITLGAVCALAWWVLRWAARRGVGRSPAGIISVVDRVALDPRRSLFVVRVGAKVLLLGGSDGGLSLLSELDPATVPEVPSPEPKAPPA
jgi:flagellar protein FliO/FliZ